MPTTTSIWAFDLGKASIGEAVRDGNKFLHKASLLIPAEFAETKTAANRRRMWRTRQAHKAREKWLDEVMLAAGIEPLKGRQIGKVDENGKPIPRAEWKKKRGKWAEIAKGDPRLEREFAAEGDDTCYTSCLLRIKLLQREKLASWQLYKALHSVIQKRGYGKVPWAAKEAARQGLTPEQLEEKEQADLAKTDPAYQAAVNTWREFKRKIQQQKLPFVEQFQPTKTERAERELSDNYYFVPPSFYDAVKMELWNPSEPHDFAKQMTHRAASTRKVRFDREDIEGETILLGNFAAALFPQIRDTFNKSKKDGWSVTDRVSGCNSKTGKNYKDEKRVRCLKVLAKTFGEFLCYGPGGKAYAAYDPQTVKELEIKVLEHPDFPQKEKRLNRGGDLDWLGGIGQKIPRFDNRIVEKCALIPRLNVCRAGAKPGINGDSTPDPESLLHTEVAFLLRLKNIRVLRTGNVEPLTPQQIRVLFEVKKEELSQLHLKRDDPKYAEMIADVFSFGINEWKNVGTKGDFCFRPYINHEEIESPKSGGRSRYSRPALKIIRELILSGEAPSVFHARLVAREKDLLLKLGTRTRENGKFVIRPLEISKDSEDANETAANAIKGLFESELAFLGKMRKTGEQQDSWGNIFIPNEKLDGIVQAIQTNNGEHSLSVIRSRISEQGSCDLSLRKKCRSCASEKAILRLIGSQNDPIVRHRLKFFWERLKILEQTKDPDGKPMGEPNRIVLEFAREDFLGKKAKKRWQEFNKTKREQNALAKEQAANERDQLKIKLWRDQGGECVYGKPVTKDAKCLYTQRGLPQPGTKDFDDLEIDHIVPRDLGGPNAYVNYVLTFREVANQEKRDRIPYVWFSQDRADERDSYIQFVKSKKESLGKKKVALLTRPDAVELVERYTALAQTSWIARLAQTIVRLHFGWPLDHQKGEERVITLTGGQTAQFRREFRLNSLLGENAKTSASASDISKQEEEEIAAKIQDDLMKEMTKNRVDPRHHALDAMVLTLIPEWRHFDAKKWAKWRGKYLDEKRKSEILGRPTPFFDFHLEKKNGKEFLNKNSIRQLFNKLLDETHARLVAFKRPELEETHYDRTVQQFEKSTGKPLDEIACTQINRDLPKKFDEEKLKRWIKRCIEDKQKEALIEFVGKSPSGEAWDEFKKTNKNLFPGGRARVIAPYPTTQYTVRKELRLLAYENDQNKKEKIFQPEWVHEDVEQIDTSVPVMQLLKTSIEKYIATERGLESSRFGDWLTARCKELGLSKIRLSSFGDESEEVNSGRKGRSVPPDSFGCRSLPLVFKRERLLKTCAKICDPVIRAAIASEFKIEGEGKKAKCRIFTRDEWETFCQNFRMPTKKEDVQGPKVLKVTLTAGESDEGDKSEASDDGSGELTGSKDEFLPSTKSPGAFLKGKSHKGYYLYQDRDGHWQRLPVYAHQSEKTGKERFEKIRQQEQAVPHSKFKEIGFLQTGCSVKLELDAKKGEKIVAPAGIYRLNTLQQNGRMKLTAQNGREIGEIVTIFIIAGLHRIE